MIKSLYDPAENKPRLARNAASITTVETRILARVFQHPLSHNLSWRETFELCHAIGTVEQGHDGSVTLKVGGEHQTFARVHNKDLAADDVMALRHLLTRAGWAPDALPGVESASASADIVIVIDHAGARVYGGGAADGAAVHELHHLVHSIDRKQHDADREETYPADARYFDAIAAAVVGDGRIVVVGHGKGQSSEADHLLAYLGQHHPAVRGRVAREIVADLPHATVPELLRLARHALQPAPKSGVDGIK